MSGGDAVFLVGDLRFARRDEQGRLVDQADWYLAQQYVLRAIGALARLNDEPTQQWRARALTQMKQSWLHAKAADTNADTKEQAYAILRDYFPEFAGHAYVINGDELKALWEQFPAKEA